MNRKLRKRQMLAGVVMVTASFVRCVQAQSTPFVPNDPYFEPDYSKYGDLGQWHLVHPYGGVDVNIQDAWNAGVTGQGVTIGIISAGVETTHPDLAPNYVAADSWDFAGNDPVPDPTDENDIFSTATAGLAAARGGNGIGVTGAAPYASLAGLRVNGQNQASSSAATLYHSSGSNTNIDIKVHIFGIGGRFEKKPAVTAALAESVAAGTIHVVPAGDMRSPPKYGAFGGDSNKLDLANESGAITVAGVASDGKYSIFSSFGSNVFVAAPAGAFILADPDGVYTYKAGMTTTDRTGPGGYGWYVYETDSFVQTPPDYTNDFEGGTSSSAALVGGVLALVKEVQPNLNTRFAKHLLVKTSTPLDGAANAAGNQFSEDYGFGLINASKLVTEAPQYAGVTELITEKTGAVVNQSIPEDGTFATAQFTLETTAAPIEDILVTLSLAHVYAGGVEAYLTSPSGTRIRLLMADIADPDTPQDLEWTLLANAFWGENGKGLWKLELQEFSDQDDGQWLSFSIEAHFGELVAVPEPRTAMLLAVSGIVFFARRRARGVV